MTIFLEHENTSSLLEKLYPQEAGESTCPQYATSRDQSAIVNLLHVQGVAVKYLSPWTRKNY